MRVPLTVTLLLLAGCSSHASKQDQLNAAANESTPAPADVLAGAATNGMNEGAALNEAARAQTANPSATVQRKEPGEANSAESPTPPQENEEGNSD